MKPVALFTVAFAAVALIAYLVTLGLQKFHESGARNRQRKAMRRWSQSHAR